MISNISVMLWMYYLHALIFVFVYLPSSCISRRFGKMNSLYIKLRRYFFWNGLIRLLMETFMDLFLASLLNFYLADWESPSFAE